MPTDRADPGDRPARRRRRGHPRCPAVRLVPLLPVKQTTATIQWPQAAGRRRASVSRHHRPAGVGRAAGTRHVDPLPGHRDAARRRRPGVLDHPCGRDRCQPQRAVRARQRRHGGRRVPRHRGRGGAPPGRRRRRLQRAARLGRARRSRAPTSSASPAPPARCPPRRSLQVAGIFTDLKVAAQPGLSARIDIDTRFITSPTHAQAGRDGARRRLGAGVDRGAGVLDRGVGHGGCDGGMAPLLAGRARPPGSPTSA